MIDAATAFAYFFIAIVCVLAFYEFIAKPLAALLLGQRRFDKEHDRLVQARRAESEHTNESAWQWPERVDA